MTSAGQNAHRLRHAAIALLVLAILAIPVLLHLRQAQQTVPTVRCADLSHECRFVMGDKQPVSVRFGAPPSGLHPFSVQVTAAQAHRVSARFTMPDMDMGENSYQLHKVNGPLWQGDIILPVCITGRHDWLLTLIIDGESVRIPFSA